MRRIVTQSRLDRELVVRYYGIPEEKVCTIYNGVDLNVFHPGVRADRNDLRAELGVEPTRPLLVFASMDFHGKGLRSLLRALALARSTRALRLAVVGKGPDLALPPHGPGVGVEESVLFVGHRCDIHRFYGAADLSLMPTTYEPFPNVNLESLACGTPALTTSTAGGADLIEDGKTGYLVSNVHAIEEIAERIDRVFFAQLGRAGRDVGRLLGQGPTDDRGEKRARDVRAVSKRCCVKSFAFDGWDGGRLTVNREFAPLLTRHALTTFDAIANFAGGQVAKNVLRERTTTRLDLADSNGTSHTLYLKRHLRPGAWELVKPAVPLGATHRRRP